MSGGVADSAGAADWATNHSDEASRESLIERLGNELLKAHRDKTTVPALRDRVLNMSLDDAYAVQTHQLQAHLTDGRELLGHKVGLTSKVMQEQLGVDSPDFGFMLDGTFYGDDARIRVDDFVAPRVEPEVAFVLQSNLQGPGVTLEQARAAIGEIYPAIEIIDSRVADWDIDLVDTVADNASFGAIVMGQHVLPVRLEDLPELSCTLAINGEAKENGTGAAVMEDPVAPVAWLANVLGEQGVALKAGQVILPGSFTRALPLVAGESATAHYGDFGSLTVHFE